MLRHIALLIFWGTLLFGLLFGLTLSVTGLSPLGNLLDPVDGLYATARNGTHSRKDLVKINGLDTAVNIVRDERGVPHIFAQSDKDAVMALGYTYAQDRLFQMDFVTRVAAGRLSEILGPNLINSDRFLRNTGMLHTAQKNLARVKAENGIEWELMQWYSAGVNSYLATIDESDYPFEMRLLNYHPRVFEPLDMLLIMEYMAFMLSYHTDSPDYQTIADRLGQKDYDALYPQFSTLYNPIIPDKYLSGGPVAETQEQSDQQNYTPKTGQFDDFLASLIGTPLESNFPGKGSNNWAVFGDRSTTGKPILAGDMHLQLTLPSIWYEVHLVTPEMNMYGVTLAASPVVIVGFNDYTSWSLTNTGSDQIDHYKLTLNDDSTQYFYNEDWHDLTPVSMEIGVKNAPAEPDTVWYSHFGPVIFDDSVAFSIKWTGHEEGETTKAFWIMNHAKSIADLNEGLKFWGSPMQNIIMADTSGNIAIRSSGMMPIRAGGTGAGLLDGTSDKDAWIGMVPFDELPYSENPDQGFLTSTNQQPAGQNYPYYQSHDWFDSYRSLRIDDLLRGKDQHTVQDLKDYQADVLAMQQQLFAPYLNQLYLAEYPELEKVKNILVNWDGKATLESEETIYMYHFRKIIRNLVWDEPQFDGIKLPFTNRILDLLENDPRSKWLDLVDTEKTETANDILILALQQTADSVATLNGDLRWGDRHKLQLKHLMGSEMLAPLWRDSLDYPGFARTLSPASGLTTNHSASWRMVVDFSVFPPAGYGVYPGGQSGNPFSTRYDNQIQTFTHFEYYNLYKPASHEDLTEDRVSSVVTLH